MSAKISNIYGWHAVLSIVDNSKDRVEHIYLSETRKDKRLNKLLPKLDSHKIPYTFVAQDILDKKSSKDAVHQGIIARCTGATTYTEHDLAEILSQSDTPPFILVLDSIQDPHNLGACLRTADAVGVNCVIMQKDRSAPMNATVSKVACGAAEVVKVITVTNLSRTLKWLKKQDIWLVGLAGEADQSLYEMPLTEGIAIVMGAEGDGLRRLTKEHCDYLAKLPMTGSVSSLNVSVATGISLYEVVRQRT